MQVFASAQGEREFRVLADAEGLGDAAWLRATMSLGCACLAGPAGMRAADGVLYEAKAGGRNRVVTADGSAVID